eukprot:TRINITY_DN26138_c0_g1_i1.p1 TRINITY_DN26138_c0_g1~~TRINITY_DN26138_c0_g1_i1.p1  ORF type:complete len:584 (-),score=118.62 TRINITY_DN26138_c0_g1_i1:3-1754(-)
MSLLPIFMVVILICLSASFSGLTLGLMSLDLVGLTIVMGSGAPKERVYAQKIYPVRKRGNLLLCTLLLGNTLVNTVLAIFLADMTTGVLGSAIATGLILVFGEISPQAFCQRYSLLVGAYSIPLVQFFMLVLFPITFPISKILDWALGRELGTVYSKAELKKLVEIYGTEKRGDLTTQEANIMTGALEFSTKTVKDIMTPIKDVFMLNVNGKLDFFAMMEIFKYGHSRIPVYEGDRGTISGLLFAKDLILVNPDDEIPIRSILSFHNRPLMKVFPDMNLSDMLNQFKQGQNHLAVVQEVNAEGPGDPFYEPLGIVCLEDVLEAIIKDEILDETDSYVDDREVTHKRRQGLDAEALSLFDRRRLLFNRLSPVELQAVYSFLSSNIDCFHQSVIHELALKKLLASKEVVEFKPSQGKSIYERGSKEQVFTLILQGKVSIVSGKEEFKSEIGPWNVMGKSALTSESWACDFTAHPLVDVRAWQITREDYENACALRDFSPLEKSEMYDSLSLSPGPQLDTGRQKRGRTSPPIDSGEGVELSPRHQDSTVRFAGIKPTYVVSHEKVPPAKRALLRQEEEENNGGGMV